MRHTRSLRPTLALAVVAIAACSEPTTVTPRATVDDLRASLSVSSAAAADNSYILISADEAGLPAGLERAVAAAGGVITNTLPSIGVAVATSTDPTFKSKAARIDGIRSAVPDIVVSWLNNVAVGESAPLADFNYPPNSGDNDIRFNLQWGHIAVRAVDAWNAGHRGAGVRACILDSGITRENADIAPNLNQALSVSFVPGQPFWNTRPDGVFNHGTHVSGIVASADNGIGTIGVAPLTELVAVKVLSDISGSGSFEGIASGILYAADIDCDIINMSLSGSFFRDGIRDADGKKVVNANELGELVHLIGRAAAYAHKSGTLVLAAAGNQRVDRDHDANWVVLPADVPFVHQVAATAPAGWAEAFTASLDDPASYTNRGQSRIDFAAPGGDFDYVDPTPATGCLVGGLLRACATFDGVFAPGSASFGFWASGTSMATPYVAGVAALIIGKNGGSMDPDAVVRILRQSADDVGKPGNDDFYGAGRVNAARAVQ